MKPKFNLKYLIFLEMALGGKRLGHNKNIDLL
jgi:hypothetical protein